MSYYLARPATTRRSSLLGVVIGAHLALGLLFLTAKTVAPQLFETPLIVDLMQPAEPPKQLQSKPLPVTRPQPAAPKSALPPIEATHSSVPAASAPAAACWA